MSPNPEKNQISHLIRLIDDRDALIKLNDYYKFELKKPKFAASTGVVSKNMGMPTSKENIRTAYLGTGNLTMLKFAEKEGEDDNTNDNDNENEDEEEEDEKEDKTWGWGLTISDWKLRRVKLLKTDDLLVFFGPTKNTGNNANPGGYLDARQLSDQQHYIDCDEPC